MKLLLVAGVLLFSCAVQAQTGDQDILRSAGSAGNAVDAAAAEQVETTAAYIGFFDSSRDAMADVDAALAAARISGKHVLLILGGDWCHDSTALSDVMQMPRTASMLAARYEVVRVHVPYSREERVLPVAQRFGMAAVEGTPTLLILSPDGTVTNLADAPRWRNAASRKPAAIHRQLERAAPAVTP